MTSEIDKINWLTMKTFLHLRWEMKEYPFPCPRMDGRMEPVINPGYKPLRNPIKIKDKKKPAARLRKRL